ncbi:ribonuclease III [Rickettsia endosymbiont of Halotydeus destructor]
MDQKLKLEKLLGYNFKDKNLLIEALSHPSLKQHNSSNQYMDYERLEFLGDAILSFLVTEILFTNFADYDEGKLAKIRAYLVCKETLCNVATKLNLSNYIIMTQGEELSGGRDNPNNIEDAMEALVAAIYLDSDINIARKIVQNLWAEFITVKDLTSYDPKTPLQEWAQSKGFHVPIYKVINRSGASHSTTFTVSVTIKDHSQTGTGHSIKEAEKDAARELLRTIGLL